MIQDLIKAQNDNVKAIVLEVFKEREECSKAHRKGIAELGTDSEGERSGKVKSEGRKEGALAPCSNNTTHFRAPEVSIPPSIFAPAAPPMIASQHHYPPPYPYYPSYQYPSGLPPQGYTQPPPQGYPQPPPRTEGAFYSVNFFHH